MSSTDHYVPPEDARRIVLEHTPCGRRITVPLAEALGMTLAEPIRADQDYPPFDRATMDGYAVRCADAERVPAELRLSARVAAGTVAERPLDAGEAVQINTGAPVPEGADAVVPVEKTATRDEGRVVIVRQPPRRNQYIAYRAGCVAQGDIVLEPGQRLGPAQIGVAAGAGAARVPVYARPRVGVLSTGDELVDLDQVPRGAQIRNSNQYLLHALVTEADGVPVGLGTAGDRRARLEKRIREGLSADVMCITGGVSMGTLDLVPQVLEACGVRVLVRKMPIKPGRPTLFGIAERGTAVFGLPGNPVSAFVAFHLLVAPALAAWQGRPPEAALRLLSARLRGRLSATGTRRTYTPARREVDPDGAWWAVPLTGSGSGDPFWLARVDALIVRAAEAPGVAEGEAVRLLPVGAW